MPSRIDICNRALARIGAQTLQSEGAPGAEQVLLAYDSVLEVILAMKPWKFTMWTAALTRATNEQAAGWWTYQYQLPADRVGVPRTVYDRVGGQPFTDYELSRTHLLTNAETIWMRYQRDPAGLVWPPLVTECVVLSLAGDLAVVLRDNLGLRSQFKAVRRSDQARRRRPDPARGNAGRAGRPEPCPAERRRPVDLLTFQLR
jgi:hypothetical protein